jgi:YgiT-type zinc finger domain-containing protein
MQTECYFCKGRITQTHVDVDFRWGETLKVIEHVPAGVCQQCGERYFQSSVYKAMEQLASSQVEPDTQLTVDVMQFREQLH